MIDPAILNLIRKVYEAAANPSRWPEFLTPYMQAVGASASALVQGRNISEAAAEFGISLNTARTQVKSVLSKTQTRRQSDLVRLLVTGLSRVNFPGT